MTAAPRPLATGGGRTGTTHAIPTATVTQTVNRWIVGATVRCGAAVTQAFADSIGADAYCADAVGAVRAAKNFM